MAARRVLLIEDERRIGEFVAKGLGLDGHDVVLAEDGDVGLFLASTEAFDVIVLDLSLPGISGLELLRELRRAKPAVPVIVLSGHDEPESRRACLEAGAATFVSKPLFVEAFRATVKAHLSGEPVS